MSLRVQRREGETWQDCVVRYAQPWGLEQECLEVYDELISKGEDEGQAAFWACEEWDVLDFVDD